MHTGKPRYREVISIIVLLATMLGACDAEQSQTNEAAREHANDASAPSPATEIKSARPVVSQTMAYTEYRNELIYGYFSAPADMFEPLPAVIMIHEWWGLNDNIRAMADRLAAEGYIVFAIDLFRGRVASTPGEARLLMLNLIENPEPAEDNIRAAYDFVSTTAGAPRVASLGWGFGGGWSLHTALLFPDDLDAVVIYYGQVTADEDLLRPVNAPILGLFAAEDAAIRAASVEAFRQAIGRLRKHYDVHIYPGVGHAFANPSGRNYNAATAADAWDRTLNFLDQHLSLNQGQ